MSAVAQTSIHATETAQICRETTLANAVREPMGMPTRTVVGPRTSSH
jgi:hypothetical protein